MRPGLFVLTGFPGTGKLTVAHALAEQLESRGHTVRVVDNHWINNPIFGLVDQDGLTPLPNEVWDRVGEVATAVLRTVEELTPHSWHLIFTAYLDGETDTSYLPRLEAASEARGAAFVPVRLLCDAAENARRIVAPGRRERMKSIDPDEPFRLATLGLPYDSGHANSLSLDITSIEPAQAGQRILDHFDNLSDG